MGFFDSKSSQTNETVNNTTSYAQNNDKRAVASEQAIGLSGDNNVVDRSQVTNFADNSDRSSLTSFIDSSNRSTNFADSSNRSTNFADSSDRSTHVTNSTTDFGSVNKAFEGIGLMTTRAFGTADLAIGGAIDVLKEQTREGGKSAQAAFDLARQSSQSSQANSAALLGFAQQTIKETGAAFAEAKDGGQSKMVMAALVAVAVIGVAFALKT